MYKWLTTLAAALYASQSMADPVAFFAEVDAHAMNFTETSSPSNDGDFSLPNARSYSGQFVAAGSNFIFELQGSHAGVLQRDRDNNYNESSFGLGLYGHYLFDLGPGKAGVFAGVGRFKLVEDESDEFANYGLIGMEYAFANEHSTTAFQIGYGDRLSGAVNSYLPTDHAFVSFNHNRDLSDDVGIGLSAHATFGDSFVNPSLSFDYVSMRVAATINYEFSDRTSLYGGVEWWRSERQDAPSSNYAEYVGLFLGVQVALGGTEGRSFREAVTFDTPDLYRDYAWGFEVW